MAWYNRRMKKITYITIVMVLIVPIVAVHARELEDDRPGRQMHDVRMEGRDDMQEIRRDAREDRKKIREDGRVMIKDATSSEVRMKARAEMQADMKANAVERKAAVEVRRADLKAKIDAAKVQNQALKAKKLDEKAQKKVEQKLAEIYKRLSEKVAKLTRVDAELQARINVRASAGIDVSAAQGLLAVSRVALAKARVDVEATQSIAAMETMSTTTKETLRGLVTTAEASVKAAAESYRKVIDAVLALPKPAVASSTTVNAQ